MTTRNIYQKLFLILLAHILHHAQKMGILVINNEQLVCIHMMSSRLPGAGTFSIKSF